ncbi:MAG: ABC transporter ATP-binding protein [Candidatus Aenigmarchaeota archaeon]|nr:ABC transporter ATP-binding protein [Candidatus Aenigmarchaeota archaeon]
MNIIQVANISKSFKYQKSRVKALDNVSLYVKKGEIFGLLGPNGAGKTTLLNIMTGMLLQDEGEINIFGKPLSRETFEKMNYVSGDSRFHWVLSPKSILDFYGRVYAIEKNERSERIAKLMQFLGLERVAERRFSDLSTGERMRLVFAKSLLNYPKILLLDEPTLGLDPDIAVRLRKEIARINKKFKTTILLTSHYMHEVEQLADRIAFMHQGKIIDTGTVQKAKMKNVYDINLIVKVGGISKKDLLLKNGFKINKNVLSKSLKSEDDLNKAIHFLSKNKVKINDIEIKKPSLEDYFIKLAGDSK